MVAVYARFLARLVFIGAILATACPARAQEISMPERAIISGLQGNAQRLNLSCESRSAVDWAAYWGVSIGEKQFLKNLPRSDNPDEGFVGNPSGVWGNIPPLSYGVHAEPVAKLLRDYGLAAEARRKMEWDELRTEIVAGRPVIVWVIGQMWKGSPVKYKAADGRKTTVAPYEHTMILYGYDRNNVHVFDAYTGSRQTYPIQTFLASWGTLGRMAIVGGNKEPAQSAPEPEAQEQNAINTILQVYLPGVFKPDDGWYERIRKPEIPETYLVVRGDYLMEISRRFGVHWQTLAKLNGMHYPFYLYPGQILQLK